MCVESSHKPGFHLAVYIPFFRRELYTMIKSTVFTLAKYRYIIKVIIIYTRVSKWLWLYSRVLSKMNTAFIRSYRTIKFFFQRSNPNAPRPWVTVCFKTRNTIFADVPSAWSRGIIRRFFFLSFFFCRNNVEPTELWSLVWDSRAFVSVYQMVRTRYLFNRFCHQ